MAFNQGLVLHASLMPCFTYIKSIYLFSLYSTWWLIEKTSSVAHNQILILQHLLLINICHIKLWLQKHSSV